MERFKSIPQAQRFLTAFSFICNRFRLHRHRLNATDYRTTLQGCFHIWRAATRVAA